MKKISKDNLILISLILFAVAIVIADLFLNKNSIIRESFQGFDIDEAYKNKNNSETEESYEDNRSETQHVKSIISKYTGKVINVEAVGASPTKKVTVPFFNEKNQKMNISVNSDGTYSLVIPNKNSVKQQFAVIFIDGPETFAQHISIKNENLGYNTRDASYPFYILKSLYDTSKALQYQDGNVMVRPLANYDSQKWDLSYDKVESAIGAHKRAYDTKLTGDVRSNPDELGSNEYGDMDKIKIKLNLDNTVLNKFLEQNLEKLVAVTAGGNSDAESEIDVNDGMINLGGSSCPLDTSVGRRVPAEAVASLCPGCNPNNL